MSALMSAVSLLTAMLGDEGIMLSLGLALMLFGIVFLFIRIYLMA
jgi:hypothetical protein